MEAARRLDVADVLRGPTHLICCASDSLLTALLWGAPARRDAAHLADALEVTTDMALAEVFDVLVDARAIEALELPALEELSGYLTVRVESWNRRIRRFALVHPPGMVGALVAGLLPLHNPRFALKFFESRDAALRWLEPPPPSVERVRELGGGIRELAPRLRALREYLVFAVADATLEAASAALDTTPRTLQRDLRRLGTNFQSELTRTRVRAACMLLAHSPEKIDSIARHLGLSVSQLHSTFRREIGKTPAAYRALI